MFSSFLFTFHVIWWKTEGVEWLKRPSSLAHSMKWYRCKMVEWHGTMSVTILFYFEKQLLRFKSLHPYQLLELFRILIKCDILYIWKLKHSDECLGIFCTDRFTRTACKLNRKLFVTSSFSIWNLLNGSFETLEMSRHGNYQSSQKTRTDYTLYGFVWPVDSLSGCCRFNSVCECLCIILTYSLL